MAVKIIVLEKGTKKPLEAVMVRIEGGIENYYADTDNNGLAEFEGISDGKYNIKIRHKDYRPFTEKTYISRNSIINISMHKAFD